MVVTAFFLRNNTFLDYGYIVAFSLFIVGLMFLTSPRTARQGNMIAAVGMSIAVADTLLRHGIHKWGLIILGLAIGTAVGVPAARSVKMTAMPQMVALFNGVGGGAVALISWAEYRHFGNSLGNKHLIPVLFAAIIGSISFWGSNIAFGKLQELIPGRPIMRISSCVPEATVTAQATAASSSPALSTIWPKPGSLIGRPGRISCSLPKAMFDPQNEIDPMTAAINEGISTRNA